LLVIKLYPMKKLLLIFTCILTWQSGYAQTQDSTRGSIPSQAELMLGKVGIRIQYYAPAVRGRIIWGGLIAYHQVWVMGAHRATTLEVNTSVEIGGQTLKPGKYALFTIPGKDQWIIIINKNWDQHLADEYSEAEDLIRLTVTPQATSHRERLKYSLEKLNDSEVKATIHWEKISVNFPIKLLSAKAKYKLPKSKGPGLFAPLKQLTMQASYAYLKSPEELDPDENVKRTTASLIYSKIPSGKKLLTATLVWGFNDSGGDHQENSLLLEGSYQLHQWAIYGRYEWVEKSAEELELPAFGDEIFSITAFTLGVNYKIGSWLKTDVALGIQGAVNFIPASLELIYGQTPFSAETYLRIVPRLMNM